jgi:hypothetical protein
MAHAKNLAHRLALGEIVCNLDADNYATPEFTDQLRRLFAAGDRQIVRGEGLAGYWGRIALTRRWFEELGGYDEEFEGWGYEDTDLIMRGERLGMLVRSVPASFGKVVAHRDEERFAHMRPESANCHAHNAGRSHANLEAGRLRANAGRTWGQGKVLRNFAGELAA